MIDHSNTELLHILLISVHGRNLELGRGADTGGHTKYVVELAKQPNVERVNGVTRRRLDATVAHFYAEPIEILAENAQIFLMDAEPEGYIRKEELRDHLDSFSNNLLSWLHDQLRLPDILHSLNSDAGYAAVRLAQRTNHTGHALRHDKYSRMLAGHADGNYRTL
jgi:sucrose-phosphate synthase